MGLTFSQPLWLLGVPLAAAFLWLIARRWHPPLAPRRGRVALGLRIALVALLLLALSGAQVTTVPRQRALIAVVDLSASDRGAAEQETEAVRRLAASRGPDDLFGIVTFGRTAEVELPPTRTPAFDTFETQPDANYSDIAGALQLAAGLAPAGYARQLVLVSDGRQNLGDAAVAAQALQSQGVRVDVLAAGQPPTAEEMVVGLDAPAEARAGQIVTATVQLSSNTQASGHLVVSVDGNTVADDALALGPGLTSPAFKLPPLGVGLHRVRAELVAGPDTYPENNLGEAAIRVLGTPAVLVLEGSPGTGANVAAALRAAGDGVTVEPAAAAPNDPATIERYDSVVLADVPAAELPPGAMQALAASVRDLGHGLVAIGGPNSYGPGGWEGTPLEDALPVSTQIPPRREKPKVAVVLVLESMESPQGDSYAISAATAVIRQLRPQDEVAVTDGASGFVVPMTAASDPNGIISKLQHASLGDTPVYDPFLQMAGQALEKTDAPLKHMIVLGDGDGQEPQAQSLLTAFHAQGITTSSIFIPDPMGFQGASAQMQDLAIWGGGRFYSGANASAVPQLLLEETRVSLKPWYEQFAFFPRLSGSGDLMSGVPTDAFPELGGYVATTAKPAAEVYLSSPKQDPVLAGWQYGLGRSVAWTSDAVGRWTAGFLRSPVSAALFARMVAWTLPGGDSAGLQASASVSGTALDISVSGPAGTTGTVDATVLAPDLTTASTPLTQLAPGRWNGTVAAGTAGTYVVHLVLRQGGSVTGQAELAAVVPYSAEYRSLGPDPGLLRLIAKLGGGTVLTRVEAAWSLPATALPVGSAAFWALLLAVAILWPLDVALRRLALTPRQALRLVAEVATLRRPTAVQVAAPAELVRLSDRLSAYRRRSSAPAPEAPPVARAPTAPSEPTAAGAPEATPAAPADLTEQLLRAKRERQKR